MYMIYLCHTRSPQTAQPPRFKNKNLTPYTNTTLLTAYDTRHRDSTIFYYYTCLHIHCKHPTHPHTDIYFTYYSHPRQSTLSEPNRSLDFYVTRAIVNYPTAASAAAVPAAAGPQKTTLLHTVLLSSSRGIVFRLIGCYEGLASGYICI